MGSTKQSLALRESMKRNDPTGHFDYLIGHRKCPFLLSLLLSRWSMLMEERFQNSCYILDIVKLSIFHDIMVYCINLMKNGKIKQKKKLKIIPIIMWHPKDVLQSYHNCCSINNCYLWYIWLEYQHECVWWSINLMWVLLWGNLYKINNKSNNISALVK